MAAARSRVMSEAAYQNTYEGLEKIIRENKNFSRDIGPRSNSGQRQATAAANAIDDSMISQVPPPLAKPKGRKMTASEKKEVTLGAKGEKGTRKCCLEHSRERLEAKQNRQRGRPPGAKNKSSAMQHDGVQQEHKTIPATGREVLPKNEYSEWDNDSGSADDMDSEE
ncbi:hypothetical protein GQ55_4G226100 [Panicum hallii var. hallii]|uniref:Uncharacterized protein n=1 Tax=Panicum hallii var. hallii TaxID=1504633 RepID=A0A2T7DZF0_9POAL|nr:hypothetical protein GQ55_4G226000 [Panicum hallii var. hallii]PUZ60959.1 hypothetical protein GQ55_4G226100 [Panicum hallii var. hallii]